MGFLLPILIAFASGDAFAAEMPVAGPPPSPTPVPAPVSVPVEQTAPASQEQLVTFGLHGGINYANSGSAWAGLAGISMRIRNIELGKGTDGNWEAGGQLYFFPWNSGAYSLYLYPGYCFGSRHDLCTGPMIGITAQSALKFNFGFTAGGQLSYELPRLGRWSLVPAVAVVGDTISVPVPLALFTVEIRYSVPYQEFEQSRI